MQEIEQEIRQTIKGNNNFKNGSLENVPED